MAKPNKPTIGKVLSARAVSGVQVGAFTHITFVPGKNGVTSLSLYPIGLHLVLADKKSNSSFIIPYSNLQFIEVSADIKE